MAKTKKKKVRQQKIRLYDLYNEDKEVASELINKMLEKERHALADKIIDEVCCAFTVSAFDTYDATGEKLKEFVDKAMFQFDCVESGVIDIEDFKDLLVVEANLEIREKHEVSRQIPNFNRVKRLDTLLKKMDEVIANGNQSSVG